MKKAFRELPQVLQRQVFIRTGFGLIFFIIFVALLFLSNDLYVIFPAAGMVAFCLCSAFLLFRRGITKDYVVVSGLCEDVSKTLLTRRIKTIVISTDKHTIQVSPWQRPRRIPAGASIDLYIAPNTPVYERNGVQVLNGYLAMEVKGEKSTDG